MRILLVEDNEEICQAIEGHLMAEGYLVDICYHGTDAVYYVLKDSYDVVILDRLLPGMDGLSLLQLMRKNQIATPVIMATALGSVTNKIEGLDYGADDYIVKPFDLNELSARIRALIRRPASIGDTTQLTYGDLSLNRNERELSCNDHVFRLSKREALLMEYFLRNGDKTLSRELIFTHVWGADSEVENGNLDNYIHFLRKRIKSLQSNVELVTIHGAGYRLQKK